MTPITDCIRKGEFKWTQATNKAFKEIKSRMTEALIMQLPDFSKVFEITGNVSGVGIGGVLTQEGHHLMAYLSEKLNESK